MSWRGPASRSSDPANRVRVPASSGYGQGSSLPASSFPPDSRGGRTRARKAYHPGCAWSHAHSPARSTTLLTRSPGMLLCARSSQARSRAYQSVICETTRERDGGSPQGLSSYLFQAVTVSLSRPWIPGRTSLPLPNGISPTWLFPSGDSRNESARAVRFGVFRSHP